MTSPDDGIEMDDFYGDQEDDGNDLQINVDSDSNEEDGPKDIGLKDDIDNRSADIEYDSSREDDEPPPHELNVVLAVKVIQEKLKRRVIYKEFTLYFVFVILVVTSVFLARNIPQAYLIRHALTDALVDEEFPPEYSHIQKTFLDIGQVEEWWQWVEGVLIPALDNREWYNGDKLLGVNEYYVATYNRLLGGFRFRQLRVENDSCIIDPSFKPLFSTCFWYYTLLSDSTQPYGPQGEWEYYPSSKIGGKWFFGKVSYLLPPGGFITDFRVGSDYEEQVAHLKQELWIDKGTRAVFIHINFVNQNLNNHVIAATFLMEIDPGGSISISTAFDVVRVELYTNPLDFFRLFLEISLICFIIFYVLRVSLELLLAHKKGLSVQYISDPWNFLDLTNLLIFVVVICLQLGYFLTEERRSLNYDRRNYIQLDRLTSQYIQTYNINAFNLLLCFLKMFKYLRINERMSMLWRTLERASGDLVNYVFIFTIVFMGFSFMSHLLFGTVMDEFSDLAKALFTCFGMMLGDFPEELLLVNRVMSPIFFFLYVSLVFFIMLNIFLAIINEAYAEENDRIRLSSKTFPQQLRRGVRTLIKLLSGKKTAVEHDPTYLSDDKLLTHLEAVRKSRRPKITFDEVNQLGKIEKSRLEKLAKEATVKTARDKENEDSEEIQLIKQLNDQIERLTKRLQIMED